MDFDNEIAINNSLSIYLETLRFFKIAKHLLYLKRFHIYTKEFWNSIEEHTHPYFEVLILLKGAIHYTVENHPLTIENDRQIIIIPPATPHIRTLLKPGDTMVIIHFTLEHDEEHLSQISDILKDELEKNFYRINLDYTISLDNIINICLERPPLWQEYISNFLEKLFLDIFSIGAGDFFNRVNDNVIVKNKKNIKRLEQMIESTLDARLSLGEYAEKIGISKRQIERLIRQYHNMTFSEYIKKRRFDVAQKLLSNPGFSVKAAADAIGFDDVSYFCRIFKKYTGMTPVEYQQKTRINKTDIHN